MRWRSARSPHASARELNRALASTISRSWSCHSRRLALMVARFDAQTIKPGSSAHVGSDQSASSCRTVASSEIVPSGRPPRARSTRHNRARLSAAPISGISAKNASNHARPASSSPAGKRGRSGADQCAERTAKGAVRRAVPDPMRARPTSRLRTGEGAPPDETVADRLVERAPPSTIGAVRCCEAAARSCLTSVVAQFPDRRNDRSIHDLYLGKP